MKYGPDNPTFIPTNETLEETTAIERRKYLWQSVI